MGLKILIVFVDFTNCTALGEKLIYDQIGFILVFVILLVLLTPPPQPPDPRDPPQTHPDTPQTHHRRPTDTPRKHQNSVFPTLDLDICLLIKWVLTDVFAPISYPRHSKSSRYTQDTLHAPPIYPRTPKDTPRTPHNSVFLTLEYDIC